MWKRIPSNIRSHIVTVFVVTGATSIAYGAFKSAMMIREWTNMQPHLLHEEMEDYLYAKEMQRRQQMAKDRETK
uniref:COX6C domain-containing protein n=1 Tax=Steinernema glaseri TaxID=37863 RepID=A0A1I7ZDH2_9BILA